MEGNRAWTLQTVSAFSLIKAACICDRARDIELFNSNPVFEAQMAGLTHRICEAALA